jgi:4-amino-4-deoxy-L-arabinose transferase-like glycosyltransferase
LEEAFFVVGRLVSVVAGAGILAGAYASGALAFGRRAGLFAAAMMALLSLFVYYAKTANTEVPYVFWFTVSLVFYVRLLRSLALTDIVLFAATASLAIGTKDQAYALYLSAPFVMVYRLWQSHRDRGVSHPLRRAILDVRLIAAALMAAALLVVIHNVAFNPHGFVSHLRDITTSGASYRMVEPTLTGRLALFGLTADLNQRSWGWPLWLVSLIGIAIAVREKENRPIAICLGLVMVSYYVAFIDVMLYNYDRYLLPLCVVQALFGGVALDRLLRWQTPSGRTWRVALVATVFAYTFLYVATVDVLMIRDSRYTVEQWLRSHADPDDLVGTVFPVTVLPRLDSFRSVDLGTVDNLQRWAPSYFILNADYARSVDADTPLGHLVSGLQDETLGYRLAFRHRSTAPWSWLPAAHPDLVGPRLDTNVVSILRDINPTIELYVREPRGR